MDSSTVTGVGGKLRPGAVIVWSWLYLGFKAAWVQSPTKFLYHDYQKKGGKFGSSFFTRTLIIMVYSNANESHCQLRSTVGTHYSVLCDKSTVRICLLAIVRDDVKLRSFYFLPLPQASLHGWPFVLLLLRWKVWGLFLISLFHIGIRWYQ